MSYKHIFRNIFMGKGKKMVRVLQIGMAGKCGGVETCIFNYYLHINRKNITFDFLDIYGEGVAFEKEIRQLGGKIYVVSNCKKHPLRAYIELKKILKEQNFDIVHINALSALRAIMFLTYCKEMKQERIIVHCHNSAVPSGISRKCLNVFATIFIRKTKVKKWACGKLAGEWLWGKKFENENLIPNAIDTSMFKRNEYVGERLREQYKIPQERKILGFVGRLYEQKNPLFLLDVLLETRKRNIDAGLLIVGDGILREEFLKKAEQLNLSKYIYMVGMQEKVYEWYQIMDVFLLPSLFEGFPVVAVEGQAVGLPCIVSDRISKEINLTGQVIFLPIDNGVELWGDSIQKILEGDNYQTKELPAIYQIEYAAKYLEKKYMEILSEDEKWQSI